MILLTSRLHDIFMYQENKPLLFTQFFFWGFFLVILFVYSFIYDRHKLRILWLFMASLFFYWKSGGFFLGLLLYTAVFDYFVGLLLNRTENKSKRLLFITLSVISNLAVLAYFKYTYFLTDLINQYFHTDFHVVNYLADWANKTTGTHLDITEIILPVGVSFYTFQSISYTVEVYRRKIPAIKNFLEFGFYVTFFPQLVAGPIIRAVDFVPQIYKKYNITREDVSMALFLIINGLFKKMVVSDFISGNFVDRVFDDPTVYTGFENLMAIYGYGVQIYCDFSGYTDIALGVAIFLGFRLPLNFNSPYKAENITDFWRRWHISLSTWLREYLYISLGGNRKSKFRTYINLMLTMLLGGLWHGAAVRFIIWGGIHGVSLAFHKMWMGIFPDKKTSKRFFTHFISVFITFHLVHFAWIFFRAPDMKHISDMLSQITHNFGFSLIPAQVATYKMTFALMIMALTIHWLPVEIKNKYKSLFYGFPAWAKAVVVVLVIFICYQAKSSDIQPFIYFQF